MHVTKLRDRDGIVTSEDMIFRVYGYSHPPRAFICDPEYAPALIYKSTNLRVKRGGDDKPVYYKFFSDEGLRFVHQKYPQYTVWHEPLQTRLVGVHLAQIKEVRKPEEALHKLLTADASDSLLKSLHSLLGIVLERTDLSEADFGVFGSLLHRFYNAALSDLDLIVYGRGNLEQLRETLGTLYREPSSHLRNEFETEEAVKEKSKHWSFINYSPKEYCWHQRRKATYAVFHDSTSGRAIKSEFEPVKSWNEIINEYNPVARIVKKGWVKAIARIVNDKDASVMPSMYQVEIKKLLEGEKADDVRRIVSYVEEFRMQAVKDEEAYVEGNLEEVVTPRESFHQITLTYGPRYYEQVLKIAEPTSQ